MWDRVFCNMELLTRGIGPSRWYIIHGPSNSANLGHAKRCSSNYMGRLYVFPRSGDCDHTVSMAQAIVLIPDTPRAPGVSGIETRLKAAVGVLVSFQAL